MRIALVWNAEARLVDITVRHELFVRGFEALGHEVLTVCTAQAAEGYDYAVHLVGDRSDLADPALWQRLRADVAVMITWHRMADVLAAIQSAGTCTIALADSDGQVSMRVHPWATWSEMMASRPRWDLKLRGTKYWLQLCLLQGRREDRDKIESTRYSDAVVFGTDRARDNFGASLSHYGQDQLAARLAVAPYPVNELFCEAPLPLRKRNCMVAIARWDSPQKDADLMAAALRLFFENGARTEMLLIGRGGEDRFDELLRRFPQVRYLGRQGPEAIAGLLADSRSLVLSSRWESGPIAAWEMLALGGTVIGPPIPNLVSIADGGRFGRVSRTRKPAHLAAAMRCEMEAWDCEERDPQAIAAEWRPRLHPTQVCRSYLDCVSNIRIEGARC